MKKDRNCGCSGMNPGMPMGTMGYGMGMPMMQQGVPYVAPGMVIPAPGMPMQPGTSYNTTVTENMTSSNTPSSYEQLQTQINNLDRRVSRLESQLQDTKSTSFGSNTYTDSNYHMM